MSMIEDLKAGLKTRQGKVLAVVIAGGLGYLWWTKGRAAPEPVDPGELGTTARGTIDPRAGGGGGGGTTTTTAPADNESWLSKAVSALSNPPYNNDPGAVYDALRRALDGLSLTSAQQALVSKAIGIIGTPPEGMPPLNSTTPTPAPGTPTNPDIKSPGSTPYTTVVKAGDTLSGLAGHYWGHSDWGWRIYYANVSAIENAAKKAGHATSNDGQILIPGTVLDIPPVL